MKIIGVHAEYATRGGEDVSHATEMEFLASAGHEVINLVRTNVSFENRNLASKTRALVSDRSAYEELRAHIRKMRPDVVYVNNLFPSWSPSILQACDDTRTPCVQVIRNYRRDCIAGTTFRDGRSCELCVGKAVGISGVVHSCYRSSRVASLAVTGARFVQRKAGVLDLPDRFIAVSNYVAEYAVRTGLPDDKVSVRPNLVWPRPQASSTPQSPLKVTNAQFLFVGRDTPEKGLDLLLRAFDHSESTGILRVVGPQPRIDSPDAVYWLGTRSHQDVLKLMGEATAVVVPSTWPEPFGRVVVEALAIGTPVIAADVGGMADFAHPGVRLFTGGSEAELTLALNEHSSLTADSLAALRRVAKSAFDVRYSAQAWLSTTETIFGRAIESRAHR